MRTFQNVAFIAFTVSVILIVGLGWSQRNEYWLNAEYGAGYAFGIIGGTLMLLLLLYPVRKHWRRARNWFHIKHWFRMHMILGILGPLLILFHSNFHLGSLNSTIALVCMLLVASSGLIGRYAYRKVHRGLYGERVRFSELTDNYADQKERLSSIAERNEDAYQSLLALEQRTLSSRHQLLDARSHLRQLRKLRKLFKRQLHGNQVVSQQGVLTPNNAISLIQGLIKINKYIYYERLFSLWHIFHMPIFFMMIISAIVHIVVVHMY